MFMPGFLVKTTLPHSDPKSTEFTRANGYIRTTLHAPARIGLPFGIYARLILIHVKTRAKRRNCRTLPLGSSKNDLLAQMGPSNSGGKGGPSTRAREQLDRLCATTFTPTFDEPGRGTNLTVADHWLTQRPGEGGLVVSLSERFFHLATESAVPMDPAVLRAVHRLPLSIDLYA